MRYALSAALAASLISSAALTAPDLIEFPEGYQDSFTQYATVNRADERKQVVKIFANDVALASAKDGAPLDSGSVLVMEVYKAKLDADENPVVGSDGFFEPDEMAAIAVMESHEGWGEAYAEEMRNGTWEYHKPMHESDYVFSFDSLSEAAGNGTADGVRFAGRALIPAIAAKACNAAGSADPVPGSAHSLEPCAPLD